MRKRWPRQKKAILFEQATQKKKNAFLTTISPRAPWQGRSAFNRSDALQKSGNEETQPVMQGGAEAEQKLQDYAINFPPLRLSFLFPTPLSIFKPRQTETMHARKSI